MTPWQRAEHEPDPREKAEDGRTDCGGRCGSCDACIDEIEQRADEEFERRLTDGA